MKILFFCPRWGQEKTPWNEFIHKVKSAGYDGIEASLPDDNLEAEEMQRALKNHDSLFIGQHWQTVDHDFKKHRAEFSERITALMNINPLFINSQTGKDYFSFEQNEQLMADARELSIESGISVLHETHRGKFSFAAHITKNYLQAIPWLNITLDISHWFAVAESFLHDQHEAVELAISRTHHIHSRVGFTEGPQITDPRIEANAEILDTHLRYWDKVIDHRKKSGAEFMTITSEFGAPPYMTLLPDSGKPIVDQWEVNVFMMELLRERYFSDK